MKTGPGIKTGVSRDQRMDRGVEVISPLITLWRKDECESVLMLLRLHYVPGGHGSHDFGHRVRNGVTVTQRRGTGPTNVARRGCRDRRDRFLNSQKKLPRQPRRV